jgi:hypothetical protein
MKMPLDKMLNMVNCYGVACDRMGRVWSVVGLVEVSISKLSQARNPTPATITLNPTIRALLVYFGGLHVGPGGGGPWGPRPYMQAIKGRQGWNIRVMVAGVGFLGRRSPYGQFRVSGKGIQGWGLHV